MQKPQINGYLDNAHLKEETWKMMTTNLFSQNKWSKNYAVFSRDGVQKMMRNAS